MLTVLSQWLKSFFPSSRRDTLSHKGEADQQGAAQHSSDSGSNLHNGSRKKNTSDDSAPEEGTELNDNYPTHKGQEISGSPANQTLKSTLKEANLSVTTQQLPVPGGVKLFALLIGINIYADEKVLNLRGAVHDACAVALFLENAVGVPKEYIKHLHDREATADAIKSAIQSFATDDRIQEGDPILIYYAGHGSEADLPNSWPVWTNDKAQMILPHDFIFQGGNSSRGQGLLDRTFSVLLSKVAKVKGNNITVIFDSCHSGSGTRDSELSGTTLSRGVVLPSDYKIYDVVDQDIVSPDDIENRGAITTSKFAHGGLTSHVLLAACHETEKAQETQNLGGAFTNALLKTLRSVGFDKITYKDLILLLPDLAQQQHPQCEGVNDSRFIFNSRVPNQRREFYEVDLSDPQARRYTIKAGEAHGISVGAEFTVYKSLDFAPLGKLYARSTTAFGTHLHSGDEDPPQAPLFLGHPLIALETRRGKNEPSVKIVVPPNFLKDLTKEDHSWMDQNLKGVMFVEDRESADLVLLLDKDSVYFEILDKACVDYGLTHTNRRPRNSNQDIFMVLLGASHFYFHLRRSNKKGSIASKVALECTRLLPDNVYYDIVPDGENLNKDGLVTIHVDEGDDESSYGFKIINFHSRLPLYVSAFFFDNSDFSIGLCL